MSETFINELLEDNNPNPNFFNRMKTSFLNGIYKVYLNSNLSIKPPIKLSCLIILFSFLVLNAFVIDEEVGMFKSDQSIYLTRIIPRALRLSSFLKNNNYLLNSHYLKNYIVTNDEYEKLNLNLNFNKTSNNLNTVNNTQNSSINTSNLNVVSSSAENSFVVEDQTKNIYLKKTTIDILTDTMNTYKLSLLICLFVLLFNILIHIYLSLTLSFEINSNTKVVLTIYYYFNTLIFWILFLPILDLNLHIFTLNLNNTTTNNFITEIFMSNIRFKDNIEYVLVSIINIILLLCISIEHAFLGHRTTFDHLNPDGLARADSNFEIYYIIIRVIIAILKIITQIFLIKTSEENELSLEDNYKYNFWILLSFNFVSGLFLFRFNYDKMLYYFELPSKTFQYCIFNYIFISLLVLICLVTPLHDYAWAYLFGSILILFMSNKYYDYSLNKITLELEFPYLIAYPYLADKHIKHLEQMMYNIESEDDYESKMILYGLGENHLTECPSDMCNMKLRKFLYLPKHNKYMTKDEYNKKNKFYIISMIITMYTYFIRQSFSQILLSSYINYQLKHIENTIDVCIKLSSFDPSDCSIQQCFTLFVQKCVTYSKMSDDFHYKDDDGNIMISINISEVINYYSLLSKIKIAIAQSAHSNYNFWNNFIFNADGNSLLKNGIEIFNYNTEIDLLFTEINKIYDRDLDLNKRYSDYIRIIKGDNKLADTIQKSLDLVNEKHVENIQYLERLIRTKEKFFSPETVIINCSFTLERSSIDNITESVFSMFGYNSQQLIGKELETLMPLFFKKNHIEYIKFHLITGIRRLLCKERQLYGYHKNNYSFPINLLVLKVPSINKRSSYFGCLQKLDTGFDYILSLPNGQIDSMSEKILKKMHINQAFISDNEVFIYNIIYTLIFDSNLTNKLNDIQQFKIKETDKQRFKYLMNKNIIEELVKLCKSYESKIKNSNSNKKSQLNEKNFISSIKELINRKDFSDLEIETRIESKTFNNGDESFKNGTIFICSLNLENELDGEVSINELGLKKKNTSKGSKLDKLISKNIKQRENNETNNNLLALSSKESNLDIVPEESDGLGSEEQNFIDKDYYSKDGVVKDLTLIKGKGLIADLFNENNILKNKFEKNLNSVMSSQENSSAQNSTLNQTFHYNYSNLKNKLKSFLNGEAKSPFVKILGFAFIIILILSSLIIFLSINSKIKMVEESYQHLDNIFTFTDQINCQENLIYNSILMKEVLGIDINNRNNKTISLDENIIIGGNSIDNLTKIHFRKQMFMLNCTNEIFRARNNISNILTNKISNELKHMLIDYNYTAKGFYNDRTRPLEYKYNLLDFILVLQDYFFKLKKSDYQINRDLLYTMNNYKLSKQQLFENTNELILKAFKDNISSMKNTGTILLIFRIGIIFCCFITILPILLFNKFKQVDVQENFFLIKTIDAEIQRENCKYFVTLNSNIKIDSSKEENENKDNEKKENEEVKEMDILKKNPKDNLNDKKKQHNHIKRKKITLEDFYVIKVLFGIIIITGIVSIFPIISLSSFVNTNSQIEMYIDNFVSVYKHHHSTQSLFNGIQLRLIQDLILKKK